MVLETSDFERFFNLIYGDSTGYIDLVTKSDEGVLDSERWFHYPSQKSMILKYAGLRYDEDLYCSVALFSGEERTKDDTGAVARAVYADLDTCHPDNLRIPPSIVVQTSEGRWHGWWVLDEEVSAKDASEAAHRIYEAHKDKGVDRGWIISKLLRVPHTTNTKYDDPQQVTVTYNDVVYTLDTINDVYGDVDLNPVAPSSNRVPKPLTGKAFLALEDRLNNAGLDSLYLEKPTEGQSWSERAYKLELELFRIGMTPQEVFSLMREAACNKYNPDNAGEVTQTGVPIPKRRDPDKVLWTEVVKAHTEYEATANIIVEKSATLHTRLEPQQFVTMDERKFVQETPTFVNKYSAWVNARTDASPTYQRSLAWLVLSSVFGDKGYLPFRFGSTNLNLWVLMLGDTTRTRKSTAKGFLMRAIRRYEAVTGEKIDIGSDATAEAMLKELSERDGKVSFMHVDEVNGWFGQMVGKNYRAGTLEIFTELYDGHVPVTLRATKDGGNKKRATTVFNFLGVGIRKRTAEILTKNHFESGFLARMLWCVADPPPRKPGSEDIAFADEEEVTTRFDTELEDMVNDLIRRTRMWMKDGTPFPVVMDTASINRYNQWAESTMQVVERHADADVLMPSFKRLGDSIAKAAALLAMYDQTDIITLKHLLPALVQGESWFNDMVRMASEVSSSDFERKLNEVEQFIVTGEDQSRLESAVRRKFPRLRPRDMEEIIVALVSSGRVKKIPGQKLQALVV